MGARKRLRLSLFDPRAGYSLAVIAGLIALLSLLQGEYSPTNWSSWVWMNYESPTPSLDGPFLTFAKLKILSVVLTAIAIACSSIRLIPSRWSLRKIPLCSRTWPAFVVGFLLLAVWFSYSVTPYNIPAFDHPWNAQLRILHVEKSGFRIHETLLTLFKDGRAFVRQDERRLFQYRFDARIAWTALGETAPDVLKRSVALVQSPVLGKLRTSTPTSLRSWNAEGWYIVLKDSRLLAFTSEYRTVPPEDVIQFFSIVRNLSFRGEQRFFRRDVCLGFCYDPVAALGFDVLPQRIRLLKETP
jgi:hypothetical protein